MATAAFQATYSDWKLIRTRKVVQIVFEIPVEQSGLAYEVLGGMPRPDSEVWCAIARLKQQKESAAEPRPSSHAPHATGGAHSKGWHELSPSQQAGVLSNEHPFYLFIYNHPRTPKELQAFADAAATMNESCARIIRSLCGVKSRSDLNTNNEAAMKWRVIVSDYRAWMCAPEVV